MKTKITYTILIATIIGLCTYIYLDNNKKDKKDDTSNITSNSNSNIDITSNIESNTTSNEIMSNSNSNEISNNNESNSNNSLSNSNIISNSNASSNSNTISNSNKISNKVSNNTSNKVSNPTSNKTSNNNSNSNTQTGMNTNGVFTGVYQDSNNILKIFQLNNKLHYVIFKTDSSYGNNTLFQRNSCTISGSKATCTGNNNTITLNSTSVTYSKINNYFTGGTLNKVKNYTIENYYVDFMNGNTSYLNTNNGIYTNNKDSIKLYQLNSNEIFAIINVTRKKEGTRDNTVPNTFFKEIELTKSGNKLVGETAYGQIEITLGQGKINVRASSSNIKDILYHIIPKNDDGTNKTESVSFSYQGKYTLSKIVSEHFPN